MSDFLLEVKVKNNRILRRIQAQGASSIAEFCRMYDLSDGLLRELVSFKLRPKLANGEWRDVVYDLSSALRCEPEELFSERQLEMVTEKNISLIEVDEAALNAAIDNKLALQKLLPCLTTREERVVRMRFYENMTLNEVGDELGLCANRIKQIEDNALRRMKSKAYRSKKDFFMKKEANEMEGQCSQ
jgi:RNA polymerase sigma factor (sigma-70 family)